MSLMHNNVHYADGASSEKKTKQNKNIRNSLLSINILIAILKTSDLIHSLPKLYSF